MKGRGRGRGRGLSSAVGMGGCVIKSPMALCWLLMEASKVLLACSQLRFEIIRSAGTDRWSKEEDRSI